MTTVVTMDATSSMNKMKVGMRGFIIISWWSFDAPPSVALITIRRRRRRRHWLLFCLPVVCCLLRAFALLLFTLRYASYSFVSRHICMYLRTDGFVFLSRILSSVQRSYPNSPPYSPTPTTIGSTRSRVTESILETLMPVRRGPDH